MTRRDVVQEGVEYWGHYLIAPGALKWDGDELPVTWVRHGELEKLIGKATDIRREEDGRITVDLHLDGEYRELEKDLTPSFYATGIEPKDLYSQTVPTVTSAHLRSIIMIPNGTYPRVKDFGNDL